MSFVRTTYPEFSWSKSRSEKLDTCLRQYYYSTYLPHNGWESTADPRSKQAYLLTKLKDVEGVFGEAIHSAIGDMVKLPKVLAKPFVRPRIEGRVREAIEKAVRDSKVNLQFWRDKPKYYTVLSDIYYHGRVSPSSLAKVEQKLDTCTTNFLASRTVADLTDESCSLLKAEELAVIQIEGKKVWVKLDLAYYYKGKYVVVDWKTGRREKRHRSESVKLALYISRMYSIPVNEITIRLEYLLDGGCEEFRIEPEEVAQTKEEILESVDRMKALLEIPSINKPRDENVFVATPGDHCRHCNHREICADQYVFYETPEFKFFQSQFVAHDQELAKALELVNNSSDLIISGGILTKSGEFKTIYVSSVDGSVFYGGDSGDSELGLIHGVKVENPLLISTVHEVQAFLEGGVLGEAKGIIYQRENALVIRDLSTLEIRSISALQHRSEDTIEISIENRKCGVKLRDSLVIFDFETTGTNPAEDKIIEVAAVRIQDGEIVAKFSKLINPGVEIPAIVTEITGISNADVEDKPDIFEILPEFYDFIGDATLVAHNALFDLEFLHNSLEAILGAKLTNSFFDTRSMGIGLFPNFSHVLGDMCDQFDIVLEGAHRALNDVVATWRIFEEMTKRDRYAYRYVNKVITPRRYPVRWVPEYAYAIQV